MNSFPPELLTIIIAKLPIKILTSLKLVCKKWKTIVESPHFGEVFLLMHENSQSSSWSLMSWINGKEVVAAQSKFNTTWGLERSPGFYILSFLTDTFATGSNGYRVWTYADDVGLVLISEFSLKTFNRSLYVANPFSRACVRIPSHAHLESWAIPVGIATQTENGILLSYKVVLLDICGYSRKKFRFLIYSSETGLWSILDNTVPWSMSYMFSERPISLQGSIHWRTRISETEDALLSIDFYAPNGVGSIQRRVTPFPDVGRDPKFSRSFRTCQGFVMYMNMYSVTDVDGCVEDKLCVWRLKSWEWQLVSETELIPTFTNDGFEYFPLGINPFDDTTVYFWRNKDHWSNKEEHSLLSVNLYDGKFVLHSELERGRDGRTLSSVDCRKVMKLRKGLDFNMCVFPQWLHRISETRVS